MPKYPKPTVGQKIILVTCGNLIRGDQLPEVIDAEVTKVGRKYFEAKALRSYLTVSFHLTDWKENTNYSKDYLAYPDKQEFSAFQEYNDLKLKLRKAFDIWSRKEFTLEQLRQAVKILELEGEQG